MCLNVNGNFVNKLEWKSDGKESLCDNVKKFDCVFFSETWTNKFSCVDINDYVTFRKERVRREGALRDSGGLVCYFKESLAKGVTEIEWDNEDEICLKLDKEYFGMN